MRTMKMRMQWGRSSVKQQDSECKTCSADKGSSHVDLET